MQQTSSKKFISDPRHHHLIAVYRIIRCPKGTLGQGLYCSSTSPFHFIGYADADWTGRPDAGRSTTGYYMFLGDSIMSYKCMKQDRGI